MGQLPASADEWHHSVYVTSEIAKAYFNRFVRDNFNERIPLSKHRLWLSYIHFFMPKSSCLEKPFSDLIIKLNKHGLIDKWIMDYTAIAGFKLIEREQQILTLDHIQGIFYMCFGLYFLAFIIFLFEMGMSLFHCCKRKRRPSTSIHGHRLENAFGY